MAQDSRVYPINRALVHNQVPMVTGFYSIKKTVNYLS